ncbi:MAG: hypothetical protein DMF97_04730 [Acidobacteria bacterium]|nr:MAG: hypothetical protein DMF97_04730 [Acidobacteriota bacterium]
MSEREAFGPNLRRIRIQRGISLDRISEATKVSADLWAGLECNDFSRWPRGIYARAYVRAYAFAVAGFPTAIGVPLASSRHKPRSSVTICSGRTTSRPGCRNGAPSHPNRSGTVRQPRSRDWGG